MIRRTLSCLSVLLLVFSAANSSDVPEQIHLALGSRPNSMVVQWVTVGRFQPMPAVWFGRDPHDLSTRESADVEVFNFNGIVRYMYTAELMNLEFNTTYYYRVGNETVQSSRYDFRTFPDGDFKYRVAIFGDLGLDNGVSAYYLKKAAERREFDLYVHVGGNSHYSSLFNPLTLALLDISYDLHTNDGLVGDEYMRGMEEVFARFPYMVIAGNHEDDGKNYSNYVNRFRMPNSPFYDSQVYSFDLGPIHWIGLSTEYYGFFYEYGHLPVLNQYQWLQQDMKKANANRDQTPFMIAFYHRPLYCSNTNSFECGSFENRLVRVGFEDMPGLESLFYENELDLGFAGHEHSYERFWPVYDRKVFNQTADPYRNAAAPVYVISGSAGCHSPNALFNKTEISVQQGSPQRIDSFWLQRDAAVPPMAVRAARQSFVEYPPFEEPTECNLQDPRCKEQKFGRKWEG
ncbi:Purple acid phosphatase [Aphelenchoides fujianensis]|nr:Purple acid phosphatase [Aphelenchoides fujianensis]